MTTDKSRADALTNHPREVEECREALRGEGFVPVFPELQPAAAPTPNEDHECTYENGDGICRECAELAKAGRTAPTPADERAAFLEWFCADTPEKQREMDKESADDCLRRGHANDRLRGSWEGFQFGLKLGRAASANETGAEGSPIVQAGRDVLVTHVPSRIYLNLGDINELGEIPFQQLTGVTWCEDRVDDTDIEYVRAPAHEAEPVAQWQYRIRTPGYDGDWHNCNPETAKRLQEQPYAEDHDVRALYAAPQPPAQADAREGLTDEGSMPLVAAVEWCIENGNCGPRTRATLIAVRAILAANLGQPGIACAGGHGIAGLGRMTNDDDGFVRLQFVTEAAAEEFMEAYGPTVDVSQLPEPRAEVTDDQIAAMFERVTGYSLENGRAALNDADILGFARELLDAARAGDAS